ncbi:MAG TPA: AIR synthase related protein [Acidimicrobiales bacterium]|nr:AIR synthase related protein [Acidimicrobiales bacterium]
MELLMDPSWVFRQYDSQLFLNTVEGPGGDATVLRLRHPVTGADTGQGLALTTDGNHRWCRLEPRRGTAMVVAEAALNLACAGADPLALVDCLNFGNPEHPEVMWQLSESIDGMADACRALDIPVVGGNVSLYNESGGADIDPTPVVTLLGMVARLDRRPPGVHLVDGGPVYLLGPRSDDVGGSRWAARRAGGRPAGRLPDLDLAAHRRLCQLVRDLVAGGSLAGVHDVADGGLATCLGELVGRSGVGLVLEGVGAGELFSESPSRVVVCLPAGGDTVAVEQRFREAGAAWARVGTAGGARLVVSDLVDLPVGVVTRRWRDALPGALGPPAAPPAAGVP